MERRHAVFAIALASTLVGAAALAQPSSTNNTQIERTLRYAAAHYREWARLDASQRWGPMDCDIPPPIMADAERVRPSEAASGPHARKLFWLYVRNPLHYAPRSTIPATGFRGTIPIGQIVVKEAFRPRRVATADPGLDAVHDSSGRAYVAGEALGLFVMARIAPPDDPATDRGWIYGTIDPRGRITSQGRVVACMRCHASARMERLFGVNVGVQDGVVLE